MRQHTIETCCAAFESLINANRSQIARYCPAAGRLSFEDLRKAMESAFREHPPLVTATASSVFWAVANALQLGVRVGRAHEEASITPHVSPEGCLARLALRYRGLLKLARACPVFPNIDTYVVFKADTFEPDLGAGRVTFIPSMEEHDRVIIGTYCRLMLANGCVHHAVFRACDAPECWTSDYLLKRVLREALKSVPLEDDQLFRASEFRLSRAILIDEAYERGDTAITMPVHLEYSEEAPSRRRPPPSKEKVEPAPASSEAVIEGVPLTSASTE